MYFSRISKEISDITRKGCRVREQTRNEAREIAEKHIIQSLTSQNEGWDLTLSVKESHGEILSRSVILSLPLYALCEWFHSVLNNWKVQHA